MDIAGVVLAGGKSKRMGTDKASLLYNQKPLIEYAIKALKSACEPIVISSVNKEHEKFGYPLVRDAYVNAGPLSGIYSGLAKLEKLVFVISCDMPFITETIVHKMISNYHDEDALIPQHDGFYEPLCGIYHPRVLPEMKQRLENGDFKMHDFLNIIDTKPWHDNTIDYKKVFSNINSLDDFNSISQHD